MYVLSTLDIYISTAEQSFLPCQDAQYGACSAKKLHLGHLEEFANTLADL